MTTRSGVSGRAKARRSTLRQLSSLKRTVDNMRKWWMADGKVYLEAHERPADQPNKWYRDRRPGEYPESQRRYWSATVAGIDKMIQDLQALREECVREYWDTPEEGE